MLTFLFPLPGFIATMYRFFFFFKSQPNYFAMFSRISHKTLVYYGGIAKYPYFPNYSSHLSVVVVIVVRSHLVWYQPIASTTFPLIAFRYVNDQKIRRRCNLLINAHNRLWGQERCCIRHSSSSRSLFTNVLVAPFPYTT